MQLMTITQASEVAGKSIQTIRRMIKRNKLKVKRQRTPQGFNYLIIKESLNHFMNLNEEGILGSQEKNVAVDDSPDDYSEFRGEVTKFTSTIQDLIRQHEMDKRNFFDLIKAFQERVGVLEHQIKFLQEPKKELSVGWWQFWK